MHYPPIPQRKSCNCEDPCISTDDVYYAGPNLPNSGINTNDLVTVVIEKLDAIYAVPTLQRVTEMNNLTTLPIIADSFVKIGGDGNNLLLDNGTTISLSAIGGNQNLQQVLDIGKTATIIDPSGLVTASAYFFTNDSEEILDFQLQLGHETNDTFAGLTLLSSGIARIESYNGNRQANLNLENGSFRVDQRIDGDKTTSLIIEDPTVDTLIRVPAKPIAGNYILATLDDIPTFNPSDYDLDQFMNNNGDPYAHISDLPIYSDFIQDSITNGVIDKAPTENAVYDALQLKQDSLGYTPVNRAGDSMSGNLILNADPGTALGAATKQYVDNIASGINFHSPVYTATTINLLANYTNGTGGVGAKLTAIANGAIYIDGKYPGYLERVLIWSQTNQIENGIYDITVVGDSITPYELTRSTDADNSPPGEIHYGDYTFILSGDTNGGRGFICNTPGVIVIGITPITFVQFNSAQVVTPGYGLENPSPSVIAIDTLITQEKITLTTTGSSGQATLISNILNIPQYSGNPGTVTSITVSSPLVSSTGADITSTGIISIPEATTSIDGYLTHADWTIFNNKQNEISPGITSQYWRGDKTWQTLDTNIVPENINLYFTNGRAQSALAGMYEVPLTFSSPLSRSVNTISLPQATTSVSGYLSSTDWNTFNSKAPVNNPNFTGSVVVPTATLSTQAVNKGQVDNRLVVETTSGYTLTNADSGGIVIFKTTAAQTLNIPLLLADGFECTFVTLSGVTLTIPAVAGITLNNATNPTGSNILLPQLSFTLKRMLAANTYIATGNL